MNLVKWFRKNRTKVMAVVVIVILFGFIGGGTFLQFMSRRSAGLHRTAAYFADDRKITRNDIVEAREELHILASSGTAELLQNIGIPLFNNVLDLRAVMVGELLFSERRTSPTLVNYIKRMIRANDYRISDKQISDIYERTAPSEIYWYCLKKEAEFAGVRVSNDDTRRLLNDAIPRIPQFRGATYPVLIGSVVKQLGVSEQRILTTFSKLLAVLEYAKMCCMGEDITTLQLMQQVSWDGETIDANFVKIDSALFTKTQSEPSQESIAEHFNKYKQYFPRVADEGNPYGFGYKLADRVQLEYIACRIDDISKIVTPPTQEEAEQHYRKNREQFTEQVPSDPNDPNSPLTERIRGYAEVAGIISKNLLQGKINSKTKAILDDAKKLTEASLQDTDEESAGLTAEQLKQHSGDYEDAAEKLSEKYKVKVYAGKTGLLSAADMYADDYLGNLYMRSYGNNIVVLTQLVFAVDELGLSELGPFAASKPTMYKNIGPVTDMRGRIMLIVRVIDAQKASEPESLEQSFGTSTIELDQEQDLKTEDVYSVKAKVTEDLKRLAAMDIAKKKGEEFVALAAKDGWESAIEQFNKLYGQTNLQDVNDPNEAQDTEKSFQLENQMNLKRISTGAIERLALQSEGNPGSTWFVKEAQQWLSLDEAKVQGQFINQLYSLVPQDSNSVVNLPQPLEFKPDMSYYCINEIRIRRVVKGEYEQLKPLKVYSEEHIQSQSLAAVHFNPANILKRSGFRWATEPRKAEEPNEPAESEGTL